MNRAQSTYSGVPRCGVFFLAIAVAVLLGAGLTRFTPVETAPADSRGELAAAAVQEVFGGQDRGDAYRRMMGERHRAVRAGKAIVQDGYPSWLATRLLHDAAAGELFVESEEGRVSLRTDWESGDRKFWYIARVVVAEPEGRHRVAGGPWVLWRYLGARVTPRHPGDRPWITDYLLEGVSAGEIVDIEIYRLPRDDRADVVERLDAAAAIEDGVARLLLRLSVPVIVGSGQDSK